MSSNAIPHIIIYGKPDCHLCELAYELVLGLKNEFAFTLEKIDITTDATLHEKYRDQIPVLAVNERITLCAPIRTADVRHALAQETRA